VAVMNFMQSSPKVAERWIPGIGISPADIVARSL
jgi:hypothetical protein